MFPTLVDQKYELYFRLAVPANSFPWYGKTVEILVLIYQLSATENPIIIGLAVSESGQNKQTERERESQT